MTKIIEGIYKDGSVFIKEVNVGEIIEKEITDVNILGSVSLSSNINGYVILCEDCSLFIPENPAFATTELLKILIASINQLCTLIDTNLPLIAAGIATAGGAYTPTLVTPTMQPVVLAMTQLQQTTSLESNSTLPDLPMPDNIEELNSAEVDQLIEEQNDKINDLNKNLSLAVNKISDVILPIMSIIDLINSFADLNIDTIKSLIQQARIYKLNLENEKMKKQEKEQGLI